MLSFDELAELDGLISRDVGEALHNFAACVPQDQAIVELGSYLGKSTSYLATGALIGYGARVYAVDAWSIEVSAWRSSVLGRLPSPKYDAFLTQLDKAGVRDHVTPIRSLSTLAADLFADFGGQDAAIGLLYIDGDHHKAAAMADLRAWRRFLAPDAVIVFDDYGTTQNPGVKAAVAELEANGEIKNVDETLNRLAVCELGPVAGVRIPGVRK
jgi:predicted O-methyltransferase YrrM